MSLSAILRDGLASLGRMVIVAALLALVVGAAWASGSAALLARSAATEYVLLLNHERTVAPYLVGPPACSADGQTIVASVGLGIVGSRDGGKTWAMMLAPHPPPTATARP